MATDGRLHVEPRRHAPGSLPPSWRSALLHRQQHSRQSLVHRPARGNHVAKNPAVQHVAPAVYHVIERGQPDIVGTGLGNAPCHCVVVQKARAANRDFGQMLRRSLHFQTVQICEVVAIDDEMHVPLDSAEPDVGNGVDPAGFGDLDCSAVAHMHPGATRTRAAAHPARNPNASIRATIREHAPCVGTAGNDRRVAANDYQRGLLPRVHE